MADVQGALDQIVRWCHWNESDFDEDTRCVDFQLSNTKSDGVPLDLAERYRGQLFLSRALTAAEWNAYDEYHRHEPEPFPRRYFVFEHHVLPRSALLVGIAFAAPVLGATYSKYDPKTGAKDDPRLGSWARVEIPVELDFTVETGGMGGRVRSYGEATVERFYGDGNTTYAFPGTSIAPTDSWPIKAGGPKNERGGELVFTDDWWINYGLTTAGQTYYSSATRMY